MKKNATDFKVKNQKVIIRCDLNVPIKNGIIEDDTRIKKSLDTKFEQSAQLLRDQINERSEFIDIKNQLLDSSTFKGKALEKLLSG